MGSLDISTLKQLLQEERDRAEFHNESCKRYLGAFEKARKEVDRLLGENERLKTRISDMKKISLAKEANFEMVSHLGSLDQEFYQGAIEKLKKENVVLKEENKLLKELNDFDEKNDKNQMTSLLKTKYDQVLVQNSQLQDKNKSLKMSLEKVSKEISGLTDKYNELLERQLDQAKIIVLKDEEIRFWKCALIELLCGEVLCSYNQETEFNVIFDLDLDLSEKFLKIKEKLNKELLQKNPIFISHDSEEMIKEKSFIIAHASPFYLISSLAETILATNAWVVLTLTNEFDQKTEIKGKSVKETMEKIEKFQRESKELLVQVNGVQDVWIYDLHFSGKALQEICSCFFAALQKRNDVRDGLTNSESIYVLID